MRLDRPSTPLRNLCRFFRICFLHCQWQSGATGIALLKGNGSLSPDQGVEHLSPIAAKMILAAARADSARTAGPCGGGGVSDRNGAEDGDRGISR